jgi:N utilization substance protein B
MLFQIDLTGVTPGQVFDQFWENHEAEGGEREFAQALVLGVSGRRDELDGMISTAARNWRMTRMAVVDRNVLRMAAWELLEEPATPAAVVIDEAIEVAKKYGSEDSGAFINGILDAIRKHGDPRAAGDTERER